MQYKADDLKKELAWSHVASKEQELQQKMEEAAKCGARLPRIIEHIDEAELRFLRYTDELEKAEEKLEGLGQIDHLSDQKRVVEAQLSDIKKTLSEIKVRTQLIFAWCFADQTAMQETKRQINSQKVLLNAQIAEYEAKIAAEQQRDEASLQVKRMAAQAKLDETLKEQKATEDQIAVVAEERQRAERELGDTRKQHEEVRTQIEVERKNILSTNTQLDLIAARERNKLAPYGHDMERVLADIQRAQWHGRPPVGPLGKYVRVKDQMWAPVMRVRLGGLMTAFAITDARDRKTLDQILKRHGKSVPPYFHLSYIC